MSTSVIGAMAVVLAVSAAGEAAGLEQVLQDLASPEAKVRLRAVRDIREARYRDAIVPLAALANDPVDEVQLEAITAALSFFVVQDLPPRRRIPLLADLGRRGGARDVFRQGRLAVWPHGAPDAVVAALLKAIDDENGRVRQEAVYAAGLVARPPLGAGATELLVRALDHHRDPAVRAGAADVMGRLRVGAAADALLGAVNDSSAEVRHAAMRALGLLGEGRAVGVLTQQLDYYGKGEGAWTALEALARIGHPSSLPRFTARLADRDPNVRRAAAEGLGRAGDTSARSHLETGAASDPSAAVRAAMAYALQRLGAHYVPRLIEFLDDPEVAVQVREYLIELGAPIERDLLPMLYDPDPAIRAGVVEVLGEIGSESALAALERVQDRGDETAETARLAVERIQLRRML